MTRTPVPRPTEPAAPVDHPVRWVRRTPAIAALLATAFIVVLAIVVLAIVILADSGDENAATETADVDAQGQSGVSLHRDAAELVRRSDGLAARIDVPVPAPGTYDYPSADMIPPNGDPHPAISPGASDAPEVFTGWLFAFNHPDRCTDGRCDLDDVGPDTAARGGSYQFAGRIADGDRLVLEGTVRLGQEPAGGARLVEPLGAEVHLAVAPHGRALPDADGWRQLNGPVGGPDFWWAASFVVTPAG